MSEEAQHSTLGASGAYRWMRCPGSVRMEEGAPDKSSYHAALGMAAHWLAEQALKVGKLPKHWLGKETPVEFEGTTFVVDEDMVEAVDVYYKHCFALVKQAKQHWLEERVDLSPLAEKAGDVPEDMFGTNDFSAYVAEERTLYVRDYKHGAGVPVEAVGNSQLRYYALGSLLTLIDVRQWPVHTVDIGVVQPRAPHSDGPVRVERIPAIELLDWADDLLQAARRTRDPDAPLIPDANGEGHCRFCKALAFCPAVRDLRIADAQMVFTAKGAEPKKALGALSSEEIAAIANAADDIKAWIEAVKQAAHTLLERGETVPGWKLVAKRAVRKFKDEAAVAELALTRLGLSESDIYKRSLLSPAQFEKLVGKDDRQLFDEFVVAESSGTTLAPESDKRPAFDPGSAAQAVFKKATK